MPIIKEATMSIKRGETLPVLSQRVRAQQKKKVPFDLKAFKKFVRTYEESDSVYDTDVFIKDMLYGIGLAVNKKEYEYFQGYKKFIDYLKTKMLK